MYKTHKKPLTSNPKPVHNSTPVRTNNYS